MYIPGESRHEPSVVQFFENVFRPYNARTFKGDCTKQHVSYLSGHRFDVTRTEETIGPSSYRRVCAYAFL
jgi:hypothetical protein